MPLTTAELIERRLPLAPERRELAELLAATAALPAEALSASDNSAVLQAFLDAAVARAAVYDTIEVVRFPTGQKITLTQPLTVDIGRIFLDGNGSYLDCSGMSTTTGVGILITSTRTIGGWVGADGWGQLALGGIGRLGLFGPGRTGISIAIKFDEAGVASTNRCQLCGIHTQAWGYARYIGTNTYLINEYSPEISHSVVAIYYASGATNSGEADHYFGGAIYNNNIALQTHSANGFYFHGTHFDYNRQLWVNWHGSEMILDNCWVEYQSSGSGACTFPYINMNDTGAKFSMYGGEWLAVQLGGVPTATEVCLSNHANSEWYFDRVKFTAADVSGHVFLRGVAKFAKFKGSTSPDWTKMPALSWYIAAAGAGNKLIDGSFTGTVFQDQWTILDDAGATPGDRFIGTNVAFQDSGNVSQAPWFDISLNRINVLRSNATAAKFGVIIKMMEEYQRFGIMVMYSATGTPGTLDINTYYGKLNAGIQNTTPSAGELVIPEVFRSSAQLTAVANDVTPPAGGSEATVYGNALALPGPARDCFVLEFDIANITAGKHVYITEIAITPW